MSYTCFDVSLEEKIAHLVLKRPEAFNSMVPEFWQELPEIVNTLDESGRLGCGSRGKLGRKGFGTLAAWQVRNKGGDVGRMDRASVFGPDLDSVGYRHHPFSTVVRNVVPDTGLDCTQECRLAVVTAADDQRDACRHTHAADLTVIRRCEGDLEGGR